MRKLLFGMAALVLLAATSAPADEGVTPMLKMNSAYNMVFGSDFKPAPDFVGTPPGTQFALTLEGTVQGDINGVYRYWAGWSPDPEIGFTGWGRWELWNCESVYPSPNCDYNDLALLIMAGNDAFVYVTDTDWVGKGIVTYANEQYAEWFGRRIAEGGWFDFSGLPYGQGVFTIYNRPSNKH